MKTYLTFLLIAIFLSACKSPAYLPAPADFKNHVQGHFLKLKLWKGQRSTLVGEIIEVRPDAITLLPVNREEKMITIPEEEVWQADIILSLTSDNPGGMNLWAILLNLTSISHGIIGFISLPVNLVFSIPIVQDAYKGTYRIAYPERISWEEMNKFARFPQGIPEYIDLERIE